MVRWLHASGVTGAVVEVGVFEGGSLAYLARQSPDRPVYGYDTFAGLPEHTYLDNRHGAGEFRAGEDGVRRALAQYPNVTLTTGSYPESDRFPPSPVAMAHIDVDLYRPTLEALEHLWPLLATGGRVYAGDAFWPGCRGATVALAQFCAAYGVPIHVMQAPRGARREWYEEGQGPAVPLAYVEKR
jgi:O-methyltransferase